MSYLLSFWPVKSFLTYVLSRSVGKYLKNKIDFSNYDLHQKKITFRDLELNTQMINEQLKNSPFKVMQISLGSVQINNPSLNLLSSKISIELSNVEVILMPVLNVDESKVQNTQESNRQEEDDGGQGDIFQSQEVKEVQKSEEYNVRASLSIYIPNPEQHVQQDSLQLGSQDHYNLHQTPDEGHRPWRIINYSFNFIESSDIPTFMLRLTNIEYKRSSILDPNTRPISDWQVILDGKTLDIGEVSMHLLPSYFIDQQRERISGITWIEIMNVPGQNIQVKLKHPSEYPQINHSTTFLVIKPSFQHQYQLFVQGEQVSILEQQPDSNLAKNIFIHFDKTNGSMAAISISMSFPFTSGSQSSSQSQSENQLLLKMHIPSIESISSYDQLKTITKFAKELELYSQQKKGIAPLPTKDILYSPFLYI